MKYKLIRLLGIALFLSPLSACGTNQLEAEVSLESTAVKLARETVAGRYGLITAEELKAELDAGRELVLIDAMPLEASYNKGHLPGAEQFLFPIETMSPWDEQLTAGRSQADYTALLGEDKQANIVVYCGFTKCARSHNAAIWAISSGYTKVRRFAGGINAWKGAGYALETE